MKLLPFLLLLSTLPLGAVEIRGDLTLEGLAFFDDALASEPENHALSAKAQAEFYWALPDGSELVVEPFVRLDAQDDERSHGDLRQSYWQAYGDTWEVKVGVGQVWWGQTEFVHLVNVINQSDEVENLDGEDKLGQPMVQAAFDLGPGRLTLFALPAFRERTAPGPDGRFRGPLAIDDDAATYESGAEEFHADWAGQWHQILGDGEFALGAFVGTDREPELRFNGKNLHHHYRQTQRYSFEGLYVWEDWIFKLEALSQKRDRWEEAATGGFEYTRVGIFESDHDLGFLLEGAWHSGRDEWSNFASEVMGGLRWVWNDEPGTELLAGAIVDARNGTTLASLEASRRLNDYVKLNLEGRLFANTDDDDPLHLLRKDDHLRLEVQVFF